MPLSRRSTPRRPTHARRRRSPTIGSPSSGTRPPAHRRSRQSTPPLRAPRLRSWRISSRTPQPTGLPGWPKRPPPPASGPAPPTAATSRPGCRSGRRSASWPWPAARRTAPTPSGMDPASPPGTATTSRPRPTSSTRRSACSPGRGRPGCCPVATRSALRRSRSTVPRRGRPSWQRYAR